MRIVIDLQGAQTLSRFRGIGRYSMAISTAIARNRPGHEILIALNGLYHDTISPIRAAFDGLLPKENIVEWQALKNISPDKAANTWRGRASELLREAFLAGLQPDMVLATSVFEGFNEDAVLSIEPSNVIPTAVLLYDLIPYIHEEYIAHLPARK